MLNSYRVRLYSEQVFFFEDERGENVYGEMNGGGSV